MRNDGDRTLTARGSPGRRSRLFLLRRLQGEIPGQSGRVRDRPTGLSGPGKTRAGEAGRRDLHLSHASRGAPCRSRLLPAVRYGARSDRAERRRRRESRTPRHAPAVLGRAAARMSGSRARHGVRAGAVVCMASVRVLDAGRVVVRPAVPGARRRLRAAALAEHVHADQHGSRRRLLLQSRGPARASAVPRRCARCARPHRPLLRSVGRHRGARAAGANARTQGARAHGRRDSGVAQTGASDRTPCGRRRRGSRHCAGRGACRRSTSRASGRARPRRRSGAERCEQRR